LFLFGQASGALRALLARLVCFTHNLKNGGKGMGSFGFGAARAVLMFAALSVVSFIPLTANAYTPEQEQACTGDAFRLCSAEIPDIERVTACMVRNRAQLSPPCRAQFDAGPDGGAAAANPGRPVDLSATAPRKSVSSKSRKSKKRAKADAS
jgi:hypothetical protein